MGKAIKRFIIFAVIFSIGICVINSETDFFLNIGKYVPAAAEKYPEQVDKIAKLSEKLLEITNVIPRPAEILAYIQHEELPIDPSDVAVNAYIENSPQLSFYPGENVGIMFNENGCLDVFGITETTDKSNLIVCINTMNGDTLDQSSFAVDGLREFNKLIVVPETDENELEVAIYSGSRPYGEFTSWVYNYVFIERDESGGWRIKQSPVYDSNKALFEKEKSTSEALKRTPSIQSESSGIISIAEQLTQNCATDYEKLLTFHDWVCNYIYYDLDSFNSPETPPYAAEEVVRSRKAVCLGYATLYAALCRSVGIPCNVVSGYALGVGDDTAWTDATIVTDVQNHAWNEAYVDGRWIIIDTTWDSPNKIENGEMKTEKALSHLYFDANLQFFSSNHKIIEYSKRR